MAGLAALPVEKHTISNRRVLNEAHACDKPSSFSRGMRIDLNGLTIPLISGSATIDKVPLRSHSRACSRRKAHPGATSSAPHAAGAISNAATKRSTKSAPAFLLNRGWTWFRLPAASRPSSSVRNC